MIYYEPHRTNPSDGIYYQEDVSLRFCQHLHDSFELIYLRDGKLEVTVDKRSFSLSRGEAILIFPNQIHSIYLLVRVSYLFGNIFVDKLVHAPYIVIIVFKGAL